MDSLNLGRLLVAVCLIGTAFIVQATVLARVGLPGATPDLLLVVVIALAMAAGPLIGTVFGFASGVLLDLAPPAGGSLGQTAAIYALAGFVAGHLQLQPGRPDLQSVFAVSGIASAVVLVQAILGTLLGSPEVTWSVVPLLLITQFLYCSLLAVVILPPVGLLYRGAGEEGRYA